LLCFASFSGRFSNSIRAYQGEPEKGAPQDIFLEARSTSELQRNALVCVMLRLLEYHQGQIGGYLLQGAVAK
jgi:hypothetical protein